jgi:hypothetical protein
VARVSTIALLAGLPVALAVGFFVTAAVPTDKPSSPQALDLHTVWIAGSAYLHRKHPYPASLEDFVVNGPRQSFVQTPVVAAIFAPLSVVRYSVIAVVVPLLLVVSVLLSLWLLDVRDWRCYGAAFLSPAVLTSFSIGTLTPLVMLGVATTWRHRNSLSASTFALAVVIAAKLLLWPLLLWLWITTRRRVAASALAVSIMLLLAASIPIGLDQVRAFISVLHQDSLTLGPITYSSAALIPVSSAVFLYLLGTVSAIVAAVAVAGRAKPRMDDRVVFAVGVTVSLLLNPILHLHYLALLVVVLAVLRPTFGLVWLFPAALWLTPQQDSGGGAWRILTALTVIAAVGIWGLRSRAAPPAPGR